MIKYDSQIGDTIVSNMNEAGSILKSNISSTIMSDYNALVSVGLFSSQLQSISDAASSFSQAFESFSSIISENKKAWAKVQEETTIEIKNYSDAVNNVVSASPKYNTYGTNLGNYNGNYNGASKNNGGYTSNGNSSENHYNNTGKINNVSLSAKTKINVSDVIKGKEISTKTVKDFITKLDVSIMPILLQKITKYANGESLLELLTDTSKSNILVKILKQILGDTTLEVPKIDVDTKNIQKIILEKLNLNKVDIKTDDGKTVVKKVIKDQVSKKVDDADWNKALYGENTIKKQILDGNWVVAKMKQDIVSYESYLQNNGVKQDANSKEWGDSCLAFAGAHTYDLYTGSQTSGQSAANYAHAGAYEDYMSDNKQEVLAKIYEEIMNGRPLVLQVNGNKAGTSRHFVTVVGFKEGVTSGADLKETDLLIIDSWDGKIERMDTGTSRFMTSGKDCGKDYSGYRLRIFKG